MDTRFTFPGFVAESRDIRNHTQVEVGTIIDGETVYTVDVQCKKSDDVFTVRKVCVGARTVWTKVGLNSCLEALLTVTSYGLVIALCKGIDAPVVDVVFLRDTVDRQNICIKARGKSAAAMYLGRPVSVTESHEKTLQYLRSQSRYAELQVRELRENAIIERRQRRVSDLKARGTVAGVTYGRSICTGTPILAVEVHSLPISCGISDFIIVGDLKNPAKTVKEYFRFGGYTKGRVDKLHVVVLLPISSKARTVAPIAPSRAVVTERRSM